MARQHSPRNHQAHHIAHAHAARHRVQTANGVMQFSDLDAYKVTQDGWEVIRTTLYDTATYPAAGTPALNFFVGGQAAGKTYTQTNMQLSGQLPTDQEFLVEGVEVLFFPIVPAVAHYNPADLGAPLSPDAINDAYVFRYSGNLQLFIASKDYVRDAPLAKFPSSTHFEISGALSDSTTAGAGQATRAVWADTHGKIYTLKPYSLLLESMQAFQFKLNYPEGNVALPSGNPAQVVCSLTGLLFRRAQ
jgi:hypothetical protein